jgi:hypothetical protein
MAVGAFCRLREAEPVGLAVHRLEIGLGKVGVTGAALARDLSHELVTLDLLDRVCHVAHVPGMLRAKTLERSSL